jgi:predicted N-acyltransferase
LGFHPDVAVEERPALLRTLLEGFELAAAENGCWLLALKDAPAEHEQLWARLAGEARYQSSPGMPSAVLSIDFEDMPAYFARLSPGTRRDMRRKLRSLPGLRIERRHDISGLEQRVMELYRQTRSRSDLQFEELTDAYFTRVLARMGPRASCVLYWAEQELIGVNLLLQDKDTLLDKFFCMESVRGPAHNLYFLSWFTNVQYAIDNGLKRYQSGQAGYETKLRLGSTFAPAKTYFRHRRRLVNQALRLVAPLLSDDPVPQRGAA